MMPCMRCQPRTSAGPARADAHCIARSPDRSDAPARCRIRRAAPPRRRPGCRPRWCAPQKPRSRQAPTTASSAMSWLPMMTRSGARAAAPISVTVDFAAGVERGGQRVDRDETVGLREARHRAGALAGRKRDRARPRPRTSATSTNSLRPSSEAMRTGTRAVDRLAPRRAAIRQARG